MMRRAGSILAFLAAVLLTAPLLAQRHAGSSKTDRSKTGNAKTDSIFGEADPEFEFVSIQPVLPVDDWALDEPGPWAAQGGECCHAPSCDGPVDYAEPCNTCCEPSCDDNCGRNGRITAGFVATFLKPHYEDNPAFTSTVTDGVAFSTTTDAQFDYRLNFAPRVWLGYLNCDGLGARVTWWQFDHQSPERSGTPDAAGNETLATPTIGGVNLSTAVVGETLSAFTNLQIDAIDAESTKWVDFETWSLVARGGVRYVSMSQRYQAQLTSAAGAALGTIDFGHRFDGIGPTVSFEASRPLGGLTIFSQARAALLFGNGTNSLTAVEDLAAAAPFVTQHSTKRDDILTVFEFQLGVEESIDGCYGTTFFWRTALEAQVWQGAGGGSSENGDLGLFGFNAAVGMSL